MFSLYKTLLLSAQFIFHTLITPPPQPRDILMLEQRWILQQLAPIALVSTLACFIPVLIWRLPSWSGFWKLEYRHATCNLLRKCSFISRVAIKSPNLLQNKRFVASYQWVFLSRDFSIRKSDRSNGCSRLSFLGSLTATGLPWNVRVFTESLAFSRSMSMGFWRVWTRSWTAAPPAKPWRQ